MQLKKPRSIRGALALATCSVITGTPCVGRAQDADHAWEVDSALLFYSETDRVTVVEPVIKARKDLGDGENVSVRLVIDSMTGASANGAIPTGAPQTFTSPSGNKVYVTPPNQTPLDPTFRDTRYALNAEWNKPLSDRLRGVFSANLSAEHDYASLGAAATLARDFNNRNTTLTAGLSFNADRISPVGGVPVGLTTMPPFPAIKSTQGSSDNKTVTDLLMGVTQVIDRRTLMQLNYTYGRDGGYLTDPYKILSVVDGTTGDLRAVDPYVYEKRPDSRARQAVFWKTMHQFTHDVVSASYRYYWDDWGITSHTVDVNYRYELGDGHYLQPHLRYYSQTAADFYRHSLIDGRPVTFASADYRLGEMTGTTVGLKYGIPTRKNGELSLRAEYFLQSGDSHPADAIGAQRSQDLFPDINTVIVQLGYSLMF